MVPLWKSEDEINALRTLLREYAAHLNASTAGGEHICLENYEPELTSLPGPYSEPDGALLLAYVDEEAVGCVAFKAFTPPHPAEAGERGYELKRLWVRPQFRGLQLVQAVFDYAKLPGHTSIYLDTIPAQMPSATELYRRLGFAPPDLYRARELFAHLGDAAPEVIFFRKSLSET